MKILSKKAYPKQSEAKKVVAKKHGISTNQLKLKKQNRTHWMFAVVPDEESKNADSSGGIAEFNEAVKKYREQHPETPYAEAQKIVSEFRKANKA